MKLIMSTVVAFVISCPSVSFAQYSLTNLVTDSGAGGTVQDPHLVNAWSPPPPAHSGSATT
jgi:hypothetical protein